MTLTTIFFHPGVQDTFRDNQQFVTKEPPRVEPGVLFIVTDDVYSYGFPWGVIRYFTTQSVRDA